MSDDTKTTLEGTPDTAELLAIQFSKYSKKETKIYIIKRDEAYMALLKIFNNFIESTAWGIAQMTSDPNEHMKDLVSIGHAALLRNLQRWHPKQNRRFSKQFMGIYIRGEMLKFLNTGTRLISLPEKIVKGVVDLHKASQNGTEAEYVDDMKSKCSKKMIKAILNNRHMLSSPPGTIIDDSRDFHKNEMQVNTFCPGMTDEAVDCDVGDVLERVLIYLNEPEKRAICSYFGLNNQASMTYEQIARAESITREGARQRVRTGVEKLRKKMSKLGVASLGDVLLAL